MRTAHQTHNPCPPTTTARSLLPATPRRALSRSQPSKTVPRDVVVHLAKRTGIVSAATLTVRDLYILQRRDEEEIANASTALLCPDSPSVEISQRDDLFCMTGRGDEKRWSHNV